MVKSAIYSLRTDIYLLPRSIMPVLYEYLHSPYAFMAWCLIKHRDDFTIAFTVICRAEIPDVGFEVLVALVVKLLPSGI
jgi:hypothetical protein